MDRHSACPRFAHFTESEKELMMTLSFDSSSPEPVQTNPPRCDVEIRWIIRRDMPEVLEIERQCFEFSWTEEDFLCCLRQRNCIGMVAERQERIAGFMIYELLKSQLHVLNFAVSPWARRQDVGTQMVEKLVNKLSQQRRQEICLEVRETNLEAQLFFRKMGLQANGVLRNHYEDTEEDAYVMRYQLYPSDEVILPSVPRNRISNLPPISSTDEDPEKWMRKLG